jgi:hypothetical protein
MVESVEKCIFFRLLARVDGEKFSMTNMTFITAREYFLTPRGEIRKDNTAGGKKRPRRRLRRLTMGS